MDSTAHDIRSDLIDLTGVTPADFDQLPDTALAAALRRVVKDTLRGSSHPFSAFQSALEQ